ncbi:hypothetical protein AUJ84_02485 [Candidatus Pacearchaeota archaeon CG1_02_32_132]|nr:MAG: hypothetical protein AUJ84_02485 [Candidatus Pacearchaeota archaeon CG1_02_32_132]
MSCTGPLDPIPTSAMLIDRIGKQREILMVKHGLKSNHKNRILGLPGGKSEIVYAEKNGRTEIIGRENSMDTVIRELWEETGLEANPSKVYPTDFICFARMNQK